MKRFSVLLLVLTLCAHLAAAADAPKRRPIIDVHVHTPGVTEDGKFKWYDPIPDNPYTGEPTPVPTEESLLRSILEEAERLNVVKMIVSNDLEDTYRAKAAAPDKVITGVFIAPDPRFRITIAELRKEIREGRLQTIGEVAPQYFGVKATDPYLEPYYALAEEMDVTFHVHTGIASRWEETVAAGAGHLYKPYIANPEGLEDILLRYPKLRLCIQHAGYPYLAETIALMTQFPQVYADIAFFGRLPAPEFHRYLRALVQAERSLPKRIMFGTDTYLWVEDMGKTAELLESADYLTEEQKADIFCNNAVRFLRLDGAICEP
jgi:predicted TIM-barrel fold metal-dependent hydrolase